MSHIRLTEQWDADRVARTLVSAASRLSREPCGAGWNPAADWQSAFLAAQLSAAPDAPDRDRSLLVSTLLPPVILTTTYLEPMEKHLA
jgi:hypothetical protein